MNIKILSEYKDTASLVDPVRRLADENKDSLGFLPASAYEQLAAREKMLVAVDEESGKLLGYVLFGGRYPHISIVQLFVRETERNTGVGQMLISQLKMLAEKRAIQTIVARVAADLPANRFWEKQGFRLVSQVAGGVTTDRLINVRALEIPANSLWATKLPLGTQDPPVGWPRVDRPTLEIPHYVLDLSIFFDAVRDRLDAVMARKVLGAAMANTMKVSVTSEFAAELHRHSQMPRPDPVLGLARSLPTLPRVDAITLRPVINGLRTILASGTPRTGKKSANDLSDLIHLASCIHHGMTGFLTRELRILAKASTLRQRFGLDVISAAELFPEAEFEGIKPIQFADSTVGQGLSVCELAEGSREEANKFLESLALDEATINNTLYSGTTSERRYRVELRANGRMIGIGTWNITGPTIRDVSTFLFVQEAHPLATKAIDHVLESVVRSLPPSQFRVVRLNTAPSQQKIRETAFRRGFCQVHVSASERLTCLSRIAYRGIVLPQDWDKFSAAFHSATGAVAQLRMPRYDEACNTGIVFSLPQSHTRVVKLFDLETSFSPCMLACSGRQSVLIPIRERYAAELLEGGSRQSTLLPTKEAALYVERAYFMKAKPSSSLEKGAIAVFYVSGANDGRQEAVGLARVTFCGEMTAVQAHLELSRQGVLEQNELQNMVGASGTLTAVTFDNYISFGQPISYRTLKILGCIGGANLVTTQALDDEQLMKIVLNTGLKGS